MPCDLIGQAVFGGACVIAAALILCVRIWAGTRETQAVLTTPDPAPHPDQENPHD